MLKKIVLKKTYKKYLYFSMILYKSKNISNGNSYIKSNDTLSYLKLI